MHIEVLQRTVGVEIAQQFFWKAETDTIQTFEHRLTCRYIHIDGLTGIFYDQQRRPISMELALDHALPLFEGSPWQISASLVVPESDLAPFVRRSQAHEERVQAENEAHSALGIAKLPRSLAELYSLARGKFLTMGAYARTASPKAPRSGDVFTGPETHERSLSGFTRTTA